MVTLLKFVLKEDVEQASFITVEISVVQLRGSMRSPINELADRLNVPVSEKDILAIRSDRR